MSKMKRNKRPNIIYVLADDMGYGDLSCLNEDSKINTVNFDRMAKEGLLFTDAHSSSAVCTPSRYSILTGRYNWRSNLKEGVLGGFSLPLIEEGRETVASLLKKVHYNTACFGKWHLGLGWARKNGYQGLEGDLELGGNIDYSKPIEKGPNEYGFDYFYGISASLDMPPYVYIENDRVTSEVDRITVSDDAMGWWREGDTGADFVHEDVLLNLRDRVLDKIDEYSQKEDPFFIYFPLTAPHTPILPSEEFIGKSGTNAYGDFVLECDDIIGKIMDRLKENSIDENTILIFTSDNGCSPYVNFEELAEFGHNPNYIYRGHKADIYEGGHRIPLIVRWPELIEGGRISDESVCLSDLLRTMAEITGQELEENVGEDSVSNLDIWAGKEYKKPLREAIVHHSIDGSFSLRKDRWKLIMCPGSGGWSYPKPGEEPEGYPSLQLYDMDKDISERENLLKVYPDIVEELRGILTGYIVNGRSTEGSPQNNDGPERWSQLDWMEE